MSWASLFQALLTARSKALFSNEHKTEAGKEPVVGIWMLKAVPSEVNLVLTFPVETNRFKM